jgi:hypothetical protein
VRKPKAMVAMPEIAAVAVVRSRLMPMGVRISLFFRSGSILTDQARIVGGISCASWINSIGTDTCASGIGKDGCLASQI